jgi:hypothetical protein
MYALEAIVCNDIYGEFAQKESCFVPLQPLPALDDPVMRYIPISYCPYVV